MVGRKNELLLGFDEISTNDVRLAFDDKIRRGSSIDHAVSALKTVTEIPSTYINDLSIFVANYDYPWMGDTFSNWVKKRYADLAIALPEGKPYPPMPPRTTHLIIEWSMNLIENYGENILAMALLRMYVSKGMPKCHKSVEI